MKKFDQHSLKNLYIPSPTSHKGDNGKVMIIAGSKLFHAASLWPLEIASKIVDMVFYSSVPENNAIVTQIKKEWRNGIVVPREKIDAYMQEADAVLIGPGLPRESGIELGDDDTKELTERLLTKYPDKRWVIDGGSLQTISPEILPKNCIVTPHHGEFQKLFNVTPSPQPSPARGEGDQGDDHFVLDMARKYHCTILLKGPEDIVCSEKACVRIPGGNAGMTKGGTGDVLAGLTVALFAQNSDPFLVATASSCLNKKAGESLYEKVGLYFNASDLVKEFPMVMKKLIL